MNEIVTTFATMYSRKVLKAFQDLGVKVLNGKKGRDWTVSFVSTDFSPEELHEKIGNAIRIHVMCELNRKF